MSGAAKIWQVYGVGGPLIPVMPVPAIQQRDPTSTDVNYPLGFTWINNSVLPATIFVYAGAGSWIGGGSATLNSLTVVGATSINGSGSAASNIGTGGTGAVTIGNATGGTTVTGALNVTGNLNLTSVATKISMNGGAATDFIGTGTLVLGTVTIANTNIAATDAIFLQRINANGSTTLGELSYTISAGASFTVTSLIVGTPASPETGDTSTFRYIIVGQT